MQQSPIICTPPVLILRKHENQLGNRHVLLYHWNIHTATTHSVVVVGPGILFLHPGMFPTFCRQSANNSAVEGLISTLEIMYFYEYGIGVLGTSCTYITKTKG